MTRVAVALFVATMVVLAAGSAGRGVAAREAAAKYSPAGVYPTMGGTPPSASGNVKVDANGIPIVYYEGVGWRRNPGTVAAFGLAWHSHYLATGDANSLEMARHEADWLVRTQRPRSGEWLYSFPYPVVDGIELQPPWSSAYTQGTAISLLTRMWGLTHARPYLTASIKAIRPMEKDQAHGGQSATLFGHRFFFLEYPTRPPTMPVNGFMATLIGAYDLMRAAPRSDAGRLFRGGIATLRFALPLYDLPDGSQLYDLSHLLAPPRAEHVATTSYLVVDAAYLRALTSVAPNDVFRFYAARWSRRAP